MKTYVITTHLGPVSSKPARTVAESHRPINLKILFYTFALIAVGVFLTGCGNAITLQPTATHTAPVSPAPPSVTLAPSATPSTLPSTTPTPTARPTRTACPPTLTPTPTLIGGSAGKIAFESYRDGNVEIYVMNADGGDPTNLTNNSARDISPVWSPDGTKIAFRSNRDGPLGAGDIYIMHADGSNPIRLTNNGTVGQAPAWSPDGAKIAFVEAVQWISGISVMNADGSGLTYLTNNSDYAADPAWSPDGAKIAYTSCESTMSNRTNCEIYVMNVEDALQGTDGSNPIRLTNTGGNSVPAWSPDGSKIAFTSDRDGNWEVYVMNADGSGLTYLTNNSASDSSPVWSPDGAKIAYTSRCSADDRATCEIYVMNADGSNPIRLTNNNTFDCCPAWSPDLTRIAFQSERDGNWEIYVMNADGSRLTQLTQMGGSHPAWLPTVPNRLFQHPDCTSGWTRLATGGQAKVSEDSPTPNRVRAGPSTANEMIAQIPPGTVVKVLEGSVCTEGLVFWKVESDLIPGGLGWTAEGDGAEYYLEPYRP